MLRFSRHEDASTGQKARIVDGAAAKAWLASMTQPITPKDMAEIAGVLDALGATGVQGGAAAMAPQRKFAIAERIRGVVMPILGERAREDRFGVLPLDEEVAAHFWSAVETTAALRDLYAWLVSQLPRLAGVDDPAATDIAGSAAAAAAGPATFVSGVGALHRALEVNAHLLVAIQRARWPVPARLWDRHCVLGQLVRDLDCQDVEVVDPLHISMTTTCRSAFALPVMVALADPAARSAGEFEVVRMAAQRWSTRMGFRLERRTEVAAAPVRPIANPGPSIALGAYLLRFDTQSAMQSIDRRLEALAAGKTPREVGIGDALKPLAARDLLLSLKTRWGSVSPTDIDSPERVWRLQSPGVQVLAVVGMPRRDAAKLDGPAGRDKTSYAYQRMKHDGITRPREVVENARIEQLLKGAETWTLAAEAADALRCIRKHPRPRIGLHRLIGLKLGTAAQDAPFLIGWIEALQGTTMEVDQRTRPSGAHAVRVRLAPGLPQLLNASIDDVEIDCVFLLVPRSDAASNARSGRNASGAAGDSPLRTNLLSNEESEGWEPVRATPREYGLILPHATFRPNRLVKAVRQGAVAMLRLDELMMRGSDFDLVRFTPL